MRRGVREADTHLWSHRRWGMKYGTDINVSVEYNCLLLNQDGMCKWSKYRIRYRQHLCKHVSMWLTFLLRSVSFCSRHTPSPSLSLIRHGWIPFVFARLFSTHTHTHRSKHAPCYSWDLCWCVVSRSVTSKFRTCWNGADMRDRAETLDIISHGAVMTCVLLRWCFMRFLFLKRYF